jgi:hypothetical protein
MKTESTKVTVSVTIPSINAENMGDSAQWKKAVSAETETKGKNGLVALRSYFLLASVADMKIAKAKEIVDSSGADKGLLSKGGKVARHYLAQVLNGRDLNVSPVSASDYAEALEICVAEHGTLNAAYSAVNVPKDPKEDTLENQVASLFAWAEKNGIAKELVMAEVARQNGGI